MPYRIRPSAHEAEDPNDAWLLALAEASDADWLVTGDRLLGALARGARIVTATMFCELML